MKRNFEEFLLRTNPALRKTPRVAIQSKGNISLNLAAYNALNEPKAVILMYDKETKAIGLKPVSADTRAAYPIRQQRGSKSFLVGAQTFCKYYGIDTEGTTVFVPALEDGILVFELDKGVKAPSRRRTKEPEEMKQAS
ncbi:MAG: hypothetical protein ACLGJB_02940 [Blastocatellia bacterium]